MSRLLVAVLVMQVLTLCGLFGLGYVVLQTKDTASTAEWYAQEALSAANEGREAAHSARDASIQARAKASEAACLARHPGANQLIERLDCRALALPTPP